MKLQWYPGHMTKSIRQLQEDMKLIDLLIEIVDARIPVSSRNPDIEKMCQGKSRIIILNKADLADEKENQAWLRYFSEHGEYPILSDARRKATLKRLMPLVNSACREKIERNKRRGIKNRPLRAMVAGIPNVGKSTFINSFAGSASAKTGNKPGVTRGKQWIRMNKDLELLDTPGLLWPKFEDERTGENIALIGSMNDENLIPEEMACLLIGRVRGEYPGFLSKRYEVPEEGTDAEILEQIAVKRGCIQKGGAADDARAGKLLLDDFRSGKIGRITLEKVRNSEA